MTNKSISIIRQMLWFCIAFSAISLPEQDELKQVDKEINELLHIDPDMELEDMVNKLGQKKQPKPKVDPDAEILAYYEQQITR